MPTLLIYILMIKMATKVTIYYDKEADFLEILFSDQVGYMKETDNDAIMERVDHEGNLLGWRGDRINYKLDFIRDIARSPCR